MDKALPPHQEAGGPKKELQQRPHPGRFLLHPLPSFPLLFTCSKEVTQKSDLTKTRTGAKQRLMGMKSIRHVCCLLVLILDSIGPFGLNCLTKWTGFQFASISTVPCNARSGKFSRVLASCSAWPVSPSTCAQVLFASRNVHDRMQVVRSVTKPCRS